MTTTLSEGVKVPDVGSVNWAGDLEVNWNLLNGALANLSGNVKLDRDNTWTGEQSFTLPIVGSIAGTAAKAIADEDGTSIKTGYVNVAGNQTVSGDKSFTGSNTFNNILPNATNTYSLGSSSYQWSSVYAQTYYYNGTAWGLDKENVWSSLNTFQKGIYLAGDRQAYVCPMWSGSSSGLSLLTNSKAVFVGTYTDDASGRKVIDTTKGYIQLHTGTSGTDNIATIEPTNTTNSQLGTSTNQWKSVYSQTYYYNGTAWGLDKANTWSGTNKFSNVTTMQERLTLAGDRNAYLTPMWAGPGSGLCLLTGDVSKPVYFGNYVASDNHYTYDSSKGYLRIYTGEVLTINTVVIEPVGTDTQLGTSTNKWKTLNGVNPGALSLPSFNSSDPTMLVWTDLDTTNWLLDGTGNAVSIALDGYVYVSVTGGTDGYVVITEGQYGYPNCFYMSTGVPIAGTASALLPVRKGIGITVHCKGTSIIHARFFPMQGNV